MAGRGAGLRLEWGMRREKQPWKVFFAVLHGRSCVRGCVVEVWLAALCVMFQSLHQAGSLCRCDLVYVAAHLGHTLLKACTLKAEERRAALSLHSTVVRL